MREGRERGRERRKDSQATGKVGISTGSSAIVDDEGRVERVEKCFLGRWWLEEGEEGEDLER